MSHRRRTTPRALWIFPAVAGLVLGLAALRPAAAAPPGPDYTFQELTRIVTPAPGIPGKYLVRDIEADGLNDSGEAIFAPEFSATPTPVAAFEGDSLYIHRDGQMVLLARTGATDPEGVTYGPGGTLGNCDINNAGDAIFGFRLLPTPPSSGDNRLNSGMYRYKKSTGQVTTIAKTGSPAPGGGQFAGFSFVTSLNNNGDATFQGVTKTAYGTYTYLGEKYGAGIYKVDANGTISAFVVPGDAAPVPSGSKFTNLRNSWINDRGDIAFGAYTDADSGCTSLSCNELGIYVKWAAGGPIQNLVRVGDVAPIAPIGDWKFDTFTFGPRINYRGDIVFTGQVKNQVSGTTGRGVFLWRPGTGLQAIVYPGFQLPDGANTLTVLQTSSFGQNYFLNDAGDISFNVAVNADVNSDGMPDTGLFIWSNDTFWRVVKTGDVIPNIGTVVHLSQPAAPPPTYSAPNPRGRAVINNKGQVLFVAMLTDGTARLLVATPTSGYSCTTLAATVTCAAVADSRTSSGSPNSNFGTSTYLRNRGTTPPLHNSYLQFDVRGLNGSVLNAKLRLYAYDGGNNGGGVWSVPNTWTENGITWNNQPALTGAPLSSIGAVPANSWAEYDVTAGLAGGLRSFGLTTTSADSLYFHSRQAYAGQKPELVITLNP